MPWWSDEEWARLASAEGCGMCTDAHLDENPHSVLITSTDATHVRLSRNQAHRGYALVILREHRVDLADLDTAALAAFWRDVQRAARSIQAVFTPRKIDYLVMGHRMPHVHCHLLPQHSEDDPLRNVDISDGPVLLDSSTLSDRAEAMKRAWAAV
ncbi:HIT family protein [Microbacterium sp. CIAB417]|uniref:HIT family protein n=1 Tax=Microbacterium sp. CIAB417 TaxID=2860287 RepID=UPI001FAC802A|nr:HIT domain-containing protein [Microbacterium sp. CIAB417]